MVRMNRARAASEEFVGQVEEVDTGRAVRFHTPEELIQFLRQPSHEDRGLSSRLEQKAESAKK